VEHVRGEGVTPKGYCLSLNEEAAREIMLPLRQIIMTPVG